MCKDPKCTCQKLSAEIARLQDTVNTISRQMAPFTIGHPLLFINDPFDTVQFDLTTGIGTGHWQGWVLANGSSYTINAVTIQTVDMRDRVPVGAGLSYPSRAVGGAATHTLTMAQLPASPAPFTDPGHTHAVVVPAHTHMPNDPGHTHVAASGNHNHTVTLSGGGHIHPIKVEYVVTSDGTTGPDYNSLVAGQTNNLTTLTTGDPANTNSGTHTHTGATDNATLTVSVASANTGISIASVPQQNLTSASSGTGITMQNLGTGAAHNNMQPYSTGLWVQKVA